MGNSDSNSQQGPGTDWSQFQRDPGYNATIQQAYSQTVEANYYGGGRPSGPYGTPKDLPKTANQKMSAVKVDFDLEPSTFKLEADHYVPNLFSLTGKLRERRARRHDDLLRVEAEHR
jgi:hypothetical protein